MRLRAVTTALLVLALTACETTSHSTSCSPTTCTVNLTGEQTLEIELDQFGERAGSGEQDLRVGPIEPDSVTVSSRGDEARLEPGERAGVGRFDVTLVSVSGRDVTLEVTRT